MTADGVSDAQPPEALPARVPQPDALPPWLDRTAYPFAPRGFPTADGRISYVDEGEGPPVLLVHGTPTWSFLYRSLIRDLSRDHRVVAPDHLGFGLSEKPRDAGYRVTDHARRLEALVDHLDLTDVTVVVHDFGGPVGLSWAIRNPDRVRSVVLLNTWLWPLDGDGAKVWIARLLGGRLGRLLYERLNFSPRFLLRAAFADASRFTPSLRRHYTAPFPDAGSRRAPWILARELLAAGDWYERQWAALERIAGKPALLLWGMEDPAFGEAYLERWSAALPGARVVRLPDAGHFPQEEAPDRVVEEMRRFLRVRGVGVDPEGRCAHYDTPEDVVSIRFACCDRWYACHACHEELEAHAAAPRPRHRFHERAVLCGACGAELTVDEYLASSAACPRCDAPFNPGCVDHHPLYFQVGEAPES